MRNFIPRLRLKPPEERALHPKFGGFPWGLPPTSWPYCRECGKPMSLVAQLPVHDGLDLADLVRGREDLAEHVLHIFKCERDTICSFWNAKDGANAAFLVPAHDLGSGQVEPPTPTPTLPEVWIAGWTPHDDTIPNDQAAKVLDEATYWDLPDEVRSPHGIDIEFATKIGGVPYWGGHGPSAPPPASFRYLLQIHQILYLPAHDPDWLTFGNFCSDGTGYLFVDLDSRDLPCWFVIGR